jgi:rhodanese-related sulfurtransferase
MRRAVLGVIVVAFVLGSAPAVCQAQGVGAYASGAAPKGADWSVPPGHYGLIASYADLFLSNGPNNGSYIISWATLAGPNSDPTKLNALADYFVVDVRAASAFNGGHLMGAVNIPYADVAKPASLALLPAGQPILVVCGSGMLSSQAATVLGILGYNVRILSGGMAIVPPGYKVTTP